MILNKWDIIIIAHSELSFVNTKIMDKDKVWAITATAIATILLLVIMFRHKEINNIIYNLQPVSDTYIEYDPR